MADENPSRKRSNPPQPKKSPFSSRGVQIGIVLLVVVIAAIGVWAFYPKTTQSNTPVSNTNPVAVINTNMGVMRVELYKSKAPITVGNFINLSNMGFYTGLCFHRVINNFMIQGGGFYANGTFKQDPLGNIRLETRSDLKHEDGSISMARQGSDMNDATYFNTANSQFFICDGPQANLDGHYAVFGKIMDPSSMSVMRNISAVQTTSKNEMSDWPINNIIINSITIENQ